jgi:ubiquinone/menaquinone biosynthesis C-methylase UbiE
VSTEKRPIYDPYPLLAPIYDATAFAMLLPFGGERRLRERVTDLVDVDAGMHVLELGCGTGAMTARLLARGAHVTGLDLSPEMLARARRRAPKATLLHDDITIYRPARPVDRVLLSFVVHELPPAVLDGALETARASLAANGHLVVVDFARARSRVLRLGLDAWLRATEPATARALVARGLERTLEQHGFTVFDSISLAGGTTRAVAARPRV